MTKNLFRFLEWEVYNDAQKVFKQILGIVRRLPPEIKYPLGDQIVRSALSIILNIAEGSGRGSDRELNRFFNIAIGSINETVAAVDVLFRASYIKREEFDELLGKLESVSRQLGGFKRKVNSQKL